MGLSRTLLRESAARPGADFGLAAGGYWLLRSGFAKLLVVGLVFWALRFVFASCAAVQLSRAAPKCRMLYASAHHRATHLILSKPRTVNGVSPRYVRKSAFTVSLVAALSL